MLSAFDFRSRGSPDPGNEVKGSGAALAVACDV